MSQTNNNLVCDRVKQGHVNTVVGVCATPPSTKRKKRCPHCALILSKDIRHFLDPFFISSLFFTLYCSLSILVCNNCHSWERVRFTFVSRGTLAGGNSVLIRFIVKRKSRSEQTVIRAASRQLKARKHSKSWLR